jgi:pyruvate formate lyase activating enzyme
MKEALLWEKLDDGRVICQLCNHFCTIAQSHTGICKVRQNQEGELVSLNYGKLIAAHIDPIEKKPLFHFLPGSHSYSIAAPGCNFRCAWCQNWDISQLNKANHPSRLAYTQPEAIVEAALNSGCESISYTYTEPTIFYEYVLDVSKLAKQAGLKNVLVSNGYMSDAMLDEYIPYLDAINVDIKPFDEKIHRKYTGAKLEPVLSNCKRLKKAGVWLEITTLLIPGINDDQAQVEGIAEFVATELGTDTPWHISRYFPQTQFQEREATPPVTILSAMKTGKAKGLQYVYAGNLGKGEDTYCPQCGKRLVSRSSVWLMENKIVDNLCPDCQTKIAGVWSGDGE